MRHALLLGPALLGVLVCAPARGAAQVAPLARGAAVAQRFCYACHDGEERRGHNPLLPRLDERRFGTPAEAYASIGRLEQLSGAMTLPFSGTDEDRRALAAWLADAAQRGVRARTAQARWVVALAAAAAVAAVLVALRGRRRRTGA